MCVDIALGCVCVRSLSKTYAHTLPGNHPTPFAERMHQDDYRQLCEGLALLWPHDGWQSCILRLLDMTYDQRKCVVTICRSQQIPCEYTDPQNYAALKAHLSDSSIAQYYALCTSPLLSGLLYSFVRYADYSNEEIQSLLSKSIRKELNVMCSQPRPPTINFDYFFDKDPNYYAHSDLPYNVVMQRQIYRAIHRWKDKQHNRIIYPKTSNKTCSLSTRRHAVALGLIEDITYPLTLLNVEQIYHIHGIKLEGTCEMRQKWYPSNMNPRTYYAMGGTAYHKAKNVQQILNELCETLEPCDKRLCVHPERIELIDDEFVYIYDLSSFTSNLHEHKSFLLTLSKNCVGVSVIVCDSWHGYVRLDLGDLLSEYCDLYNGVLFSLERVMSTNESYYLEMEQEVASLLGIYGNITSARFLHAIVMLQLVDRQTKLNTAGDDGIIATKSERMPYNAICTMGVMAWEKATTTKERGGVCLKRPISQMGNRVRVGSLAIWPSFEYPKDQSKIDNRYTFLKRMTSKQRTNSTCSSIMGFLRWCTDQIFQSGDLLLIHRYIELLYDSHGLPKGGYVPQIGGGDKPFVCCIHGNYIGKDPISYTITYNYRGLAKIPLRNTIKFEETMLSEGTFMCNGNAKLSYLVKMGYLLESKEHRLLYGEEGVNELIAEFSTTERVVNQYVVIGTVPQRFGMPLVE